MGQNDLENPLKFCDLERFFQWYNSLPWTIKDEIEMSRVGKDKISFVFPGTIQMDWTGRELTKGRVLNIIKEAFAPTPKEPESEKNPRQRTGLGYVNHHPARIGG